MNIIRVKQPGTNTWQVLKDAFVKTNAGWQSVKTMYVKTDDNTWVPLIAGTKPIISSLTPNSVLLAGINNLRTTVKGSNFYGELVATIVYTAVGDSSIRRLIIPTPDITIVDEYTLSFKNPNIFNSNVSNVGGSFISIARKITNTIYEEGNAVQYPLLSSYNFSARLNGLSADFIITNSGFYGGRVTINCPLVFGSSSGFINLNNQGSGSISARTSPVLLNPSIRIPYIIRWPDGKSNSGDLNPPRKR